MLKFKLEIPKNYNFTPAGLIYMYCYMTVTVFCKQ